MRLIINLMLFYVIVARIIFADEVIALVEQVRPAIVFIGGGSGVLISADGEIITNHHVVDENIAVMVFLSDGRGFRAQVIGRDRQGDLALLKINSASALPFLSFGDSAKLSRGQFCLVAGNPLARGALMPTLREPTMSFSAGVISALHQFRQGYNDAIVIDAAVNPGNSGGALVNKNGALIGICGMTQTRLGLKSSTGAGFAIPVNQLKLWLPFLRNAKGGNVFHGRITGLKLQENNGQVRVVNNNAIGLQTDDLIISFMNYHVPTMARFDGIQGIYPAGTNMHIVVERHGAEKTLRFSLPPLRPYLPTFSLTHANANDDFPRVKNITTNSNAENAGLKINDEILSINNLPVRVSGLTSLNNYLNNLHLGETINLEIRRHHEKLTIEFVAD